MTVEQAAATLQSRVGKGGITSVGIGLKYKGGVRTDMVAVVVGVEVKKPRSALAADEMIPARIDDVWTDVQEVGEVKAQGHHLPQPVRPQSIARFRPCPPGSSVGHINVTAGTLGLWVAGADGKPLLLSNSHVIANSGVASRGDAIVQPGVYDGGQAGRDTIAHLKDWVDIRFEGGVPGKNKAASLLWKVWKAPANALARVVGCPYRLVVAIPGAIPQARNLVDAAVATPIEADLVHLNVLGLGPITGVVELALGDAVQKVGRTTDHTRGTVEQWGVTVRVSYGNQGTATFENQIGIRGADGRDFSAGGDSGSAVCTEDMEFGGLLFAGGGGITFANEAKHVMQLLGVTLGGEN